jgi:hypothetical protein
LMIPQLVGHGREAEEDTAAAVSAEEAWGR